MKCVYGVINILMVRENLCWGDIAELCPPSARSIGGEDDSVDVRSSLGSGDNTEKRIVCTVKVEPD